MLSNPRIRRRRFFKKDVDSNLPAEILLAEGHWLLHGSDLWGAVCAAVSGPFARNAGRSGSFSKTPRGAGAKARRGRCVSFWIAFGRGLDDRPSGRQTSSRLWPETFRADNLDFMMEKSAADCCSAEGKTVSGDTVFTLVYTITRLLPSGLGRDFRAPNAQPPKGLCR